MRRADYSSFSVAHSLRRVIDLMGECAAKVNADKAAEVVVVVVIVVVFNSY